MNDDVTWARAVLGPANPVPPGRPAAPGAPVVAMAAPRSTRRALVVGALASAAALVAAVVAAVVLGGGPGATSRHVPATTAVVFSAASTTEAARTADISVSVTTASATVSGQGAANLANGDSVFTVDLPASLGQIQVLTTGGTAYVQVPNALTSLTGGKPWASVTTGSVGAPGSVSFDASQLLDSLRSIAGPVTVVGTGDTVHGDPTTHYRATIDLSRLAANAPAALGLLNGNRSVPVDVWVDASGRLRRLTASFDASGTRGASLGTVQVTAELWDFGTDVHVTAPPADQVADGTSLLPAAQRLLPGV